MSTLSRFTFCAVLSLTAAACGKKSDSAEGAAAADRFAPAAELTLAGLDNLKIDVAEDTTASPSGNQFMIITMDESFTVGPVGPSTPATLEDAKKRATERDKGTNIKTETLKDGWLVKYRAKGSLGESFYVTIRRTIGGKDYVCSTSVGYESLRDGAIAACKSLRQ